MDESCTSELHLPYIDVFELPDAGMRMYGWMVWERRSCSLAAQCHHCCDLIIYIHKCLCAQLQCVACAKLLQVAPPTSVTLAVSVLSSNSSRQIIRADAADTHVFCTNAIADQMCSQHAPTSLLHTQHGSCCIVRMKVGTQIR